MPWGQITPLRGSTLPVFTSGACWTLTELIELVENDSYWIAFSAGVFCFFFLIGLTLSSAGCVAKLAGKAAWCCVGMEMGRSGRALV